MESQSFTFFQARNVGETINATFEFIRQEFKPLGKNIIFIGGPLIVLIALINNFFFANVLTFDPDFVMSSSYWLANFLLYFLQFSVATLLVVVINHYILKYINNDDRRLDPVTLFIDSYKDFWRIFGVTFLTSIIIGIGFVLLLIPGIYLAISLCLVDTVIIHERLNFSDALNRSMRLIKDYWWATLGFIIVTWIIVYVMQIVIQIPIYIISFIIGFHNTGEGFNLITNNRWWISIATSIGHISYLFYSIFVIGLAVHFYSQREKKEASGLQRKIDTLGDSPLA